MDNQQATSPNRDTSFKQNSPEPIPHERFYGKKRTWGRIIDQFNKALSQQTTGARSLTGSPTSPPPLPQGIPISQHAVRASMEPLPNNCLQGPHHQNHTLGDQPIPARLPSNSISTPAAPEADMVEHAANTSEASQDTNEFSDVITENILLSHQPIYSSSMNDSVAAIELSRDGSFLVAAADNGDVCVINMSPEVFSVHPLSPTGTQVLTTDNEEPVDYDSESENSTHVSCLTLDTDQKTVAIGHDDGHVQLYSLAGTQCSEVDNKILPPDTDMPEEECAALAFTDNDERLLIVRDNGSVDQCYIENGAVYFSRRLSSEQGTHNHRASMITNNIDTHTVLVLTPSNWLQMINYRTGECHSIRQFAPRASAVFETSEYYALAHSISDYNAEILIHDKHSDELCHRIEVASKYAMEGTFTMTSDGRWLLCGHGNSITIRDLQGNQQLKTIAVGDAELIGLFCHPQYAWIILARNREVIITEIIPQESQQRDHWIEA